MKYTASEIIDQALRIANLNNTDFLTYREKMDYLNASFNSLYNLAINKDDLYWLKTATTRGSTHDGYTDYYLPIDFYLLRSVKDRSGQILVRKSASERKVGYEIINGLLRIYGFHDEVTIEYWPVPPFVTFKREKTTIPITDIPVAAYDDLLVFEDTSGVFLNDNVSFESITDGRPVLAGKKQLLIEEDDGYSLYLWNDSWHKVAVGTGIPILSYDGNILFAVEEDNVIAIKSFKTTIATFEGTIVNPTSNGILNKEHNMLVIADDYKLKVFGRPFDEEVTVTSNIIRRAEWEHYDAFIYQDDHKVYIGLIDEEGNFQYDITDVDSATEPVILKADKDGYGLLGFDGQFFIEGWLPETLLDYPNNLFYRAIASDLAVAFLSKQGGDIETVLAISQQYTNSFLKSLDSSDDYQRIKNVY